MFLLARYGHSVIITCKKMWSDCRHSREKATRAARLNCFAIAARTVHIFTSPWRTSYWFYEISRSSHHLCQSFRQKEVILLAFGFSRQCWGRAWGSVVCANLRIENPAKLNQKQQCHSLTHRAIHELRRARLKWTGRQRRKRRSWRGLEPVSRKTRYPIGPAKSPETTQWILRVFFSSIPLFWIPALFTVTHQVFYLSFNT